MLQFYYLVGIVIIAYGLRVAFKGYALKSKSRMLLGLAAVPVGVSQFFHQDKPIALALIIFGVILFALSLFVLKGEVSRRRNLNPDNRK